jgi:hypothetical protein
LTDLSEIGTGETSSVLGEEVEINPGCQGRLSESRLEDGKPGRLIGQRNVDELMSVGSDWLCWDDKPGQDVQVGAELGRFGQVGLTVSA